MLKNVKGFEPLSKNIDLKIWLAISSWWVQVDGCKSSVKDCFQQSKYKF
jgi:hypothetical protein